MQRHDLLKKHRIGAPTLQRLARNGEWRRPPTMKPGRLARPGRPRLLADATIALLRVAYETDSSMTVEGIADKFAVPLRTLRRFAKAGHWTRARFRVVSALKGAQLRVYSKLRRDYPRERALREALTVRP